MGGLLSILHTGFLCLGWVVEVHYAFQVSDTFIEGAHECLCSICEHLGERSCDLLINFLYLGEDVAVEPCVD